MPTPSNDLRALIETLAAELHRTHAGAADAAWRACRHGLCVEARLAVTPTAAADDDAVLPADPANWHAETRAGYRRGFLDASSGVPDLIIALDTLNDRHGEVALALSARSRRRGKPWVAMITAGREAPDSNMVGGASHGLGDTAAEALTAALAGWGLASATPEAELTARIGAHGALDYRPVDERQPTHEAPDSGA